MSSRLITLTTDFGLVDHFVGVMKGVILGLAPSARMIDITHQVTPYDLSEAAFIVGETWPYFPKNTVHLVVVDPGVGSTRRPLLVEAAGQFFIGPDNGVFSLVYDTAPHKVRELSNPKRMRHEISQTFHGRDVFAPAAAHLIGGARPASFGKRIEDYLRLPLGTPEQISKQSWRGCVLKIDHFGNLITNFKTQDFALNTQPFEMKIAGHCVGRLAPTYADMEPGQPFVIAGSSGYWEIVANRASAAQKLGGTAGIAVELEIF